MPDANDNLLFNLHRLATGQDEDFLTESFVHLLRNLLINEKEAFLEILKKITKDLDLSFEDLGDLRINSQVLTDEGIPDIELCTDKHRILIEVKVESGFGKGQLERYKNILKEDYRHPNTCLTALTKYPVSASQVSNVCDIDVRWVQIADWLERLVLQNSVTSFLLDQFVEFLKARGMGMESISWELINGLNSFRSLMVMLGEVLAANNLDHAKSVGYDYYGYYLDSQNFFIGLYYETPHLLTFLTAGSFMLKRTGDIQIGKIVNNRWRSDLDLQSEENYFFSRSKVNQMECINQFLKQSIQYARTLVE
jgi:hypothetical protein